MASAAFLKSNIDLHDLASKLGLARDSGGNYHAPNRKDANASLSIFDGDNGPRWMDHANPDEGQGSCIDLIMYVENIDEVGDAMRRLNEIYGYSTDKPDNAAQQPKQNKMDWLGDLVLANPSDARGYLIDERKIPENVVDHFIKKKVIGFSDWVSSEIAPGQKGHCGPAVAFPVRCMLTNRVVGVDYRFIDKALNGGLKTKSQGAKSGYPYIPDVYGLKAAHTVIVFESAINALSAMAALDPNCTSKTGYSALATRGVLVKAIDWRFLQGKSVILCYDNDKPIEDGVMRGRRPGPETDWLLYELLVALDIRCMICDKRMWLGINDANELLVKNGQTLIVDKGKVNIDKGLAKTKRLLLRVEPWLIPGLSGGDDELDFATKSKRRLHLADHNYSIYWQYRVKAEFTSYLRITEEDGVQNKTYLDLCGFRIASLSKVEISSATAALTGEKDNQVNTVFVASVQLPRHDKLKRRVLEDEHFHNIDLWGKFGPIYRPAQFKRMLTILESGTHLGARKAVNFVGLAWQDGKPIAIEGPDCHFTDPKQQCPYHNLQFPSGPIHHAAQVIDAYDKTFKESSALMLLVWGLGAHIKTYLGIWPHMTLPAEKASGKSTLIKRFERTISMTMFSGQSMQTQYRLMTSIANTTHPVGWEEFSAQKQHVIDAGIVMLQESYQSSITKRGTEMTEYTLIAPVLIAGEEVSVNSLLGKLVSTNLEGKKATPLPDSLPQFPIKEWLGFLTRINRAQMQINYAKSIGFMAENCIGSKNEKENGSSRIRDNYACLHLAWMLLCEFADVAPNLGNFSDNLIKDMNTHIKETENDREPFVWIMELLFTEIDAGMFRQPYIYEMCEEKFCLIIRTSSIMHHIKTSPALKSTFDALPVKSDRVLKKQLSGVGIVVKDGFERSINNKRYSGMVALSVDALKRFGLNPTLPEVQPINTGYEQR